AELPLVERWIQPGGYSAESGYTVMRAILDGPDVPTAIVAGNDTIAIGVISAIVESGRRVPCDIAVVGFDDIPLARYMSPPLTTMHLPAGVMAETCGTMLHRLIKGEALADRTRIFDAELVVRSSSGSACIHDASPTSEPRE
ncbi:MAG TPA: substrate-binding domain-containing protein, partial [Thermomicrobiales bacterium]|nr:substrate-binding domain-containing protein [Thermomicrobiales bacterium]